MNQTKNSSSSLYIGLMSGTSADGIDLALVDFSSGSPHLLASYYQAYDAIMYQKITRLYQTGDNEINQAFSLDIELAHLFSSAIAAFLQQENISADDIQAIGNHGQTIRHQPNKNKHCAFPFTLQIGCSQTLATLTNIRVVGQFRTKDIAVGGQGAPLVPAFHQVLFHEPNDVFVVNIGGIANITYLPIDKNNSVLGFDTGPGNALLDDWYKQHQQGQYDINGNWASSGQINLALLNELLNDEYFHKTGPKSTGREHFHLTWLAPYLSKKSLAPQDIQATLTALTATSICEKITELSTKGNVYLCGGGAHNKYLKKLIKQQLKQHSIVNVNTNNINNDSFEAMAFAWFAYAYDKKIIGNIPAVTGASKEVILGVGYYP